MNKLKALIAILFIGTAVSAQSPLISTWVMKEKQHISGPNYENALPKKITLLQQKDSLIIESTFDE
ncbi:MAG TPA: hypothetical protein VJ647_00325, partial [Chitinophagaceae bacterium]|nr:hypothetical protein [Chitinophagaceae bacterium]